MRVLLAEDEPLQRRVLTEMLEEFGYSVTQARDGAEAWSRLQGDDPPRLVLLDWYMPGVDGVNLCRRIKARPDSFPYTYTLLTTHRSDTSAAPQALDAGADDFVSKPFDRAELQARLGVGRRVLAYDDSLRTQRSVLQRYTADLEALAEGRAQQLLHTERVATLGLLAAGMAHEVSNPATAASAGAAAARSAFERAREALRAEWSGLSTEARQALEESERVLPEALDTIQDAAQRVGVLVRRLKTYSRREQAERVSSPLEERVEAALLLCAAEFKRRGTRVTFRRQSACRVQVAPQQVEQVLVNLLINAAQAVQVLEERKVNVRVEASGRWARVVVEDSGPGIPREHLRRIWEPFFTTKPPAEGTGLGLSICRDIADAHRGALRAHNRPEGGASFVLELPLTEE